MQSIPSFTEHVTQAADTRLHYIQAGQGDLLILIHGSVCDYRYWRWQMGQFSAVGRVAAPSLPGCWPEAVGPAVALDDAVNAKETPSDDAVNAWVTPLDEAVNAGETAGADTPYSMERHVQALLDLCMELSPQRPVRLLGHSRGAQVALEAALAMPERVAGLILADPGFPFTDEPPVQPVHARIARKLGSAPLDEVIGEFVDAVNGPGTWRQTVSWFKEMVRANAWTLLPQLRDIDRSIDAGALAGRLKCPVLLLGGEFSPPRYGERIARLLQALPEASAITIPRAAHGMNLANARRFNEVVLKFLGEL